MEILKEFIATYGTTILYTVLTAIASYVGLAVKRVYEKYVNDKTKKDVVETTCKYVEQLYVDLSGEEKLAMAINGATELLAEKGIMISEVELRMLIEATVNSFKKSIGGE